MAETITICLDAETSRALDILTRDGASRSAAIRQAVIEAGMRAERAAAMKWVVLRVDLGEPDGVDIAQLIAAERRDEH
jgi:predicted transcriptional regulator